jgi:hypothetical protein
VSSSDIHQALILHPRYVSEKVALNQKGAKNYVPIRTTGINMD